MLVMLTAMLDLVGVIGMNQEENSSHDLSSVVKHTNMYHTAITPRRPVGKHFCSMQSLSDSFIQSSLFYCILHIPNV